MKIKEGKEFMKKFRNKCFKDNDKFLIVHFSQEDDQYNGCDNLDSADAIILIKQLIENKGLSSEVIASMNINNLTKTEV